MSSAGARSEGPSMATEPIWEIRWLFFEDADSYEKVNEQLRTVAAGWRPIGYRPNPEGGWVLLVTRKVEK